MAENPDVDEGIAKKYPQVIYNSALGELNKKILKDAETDANIRAAKEQLAGKDKMPYTNRKLPTVLN